MRVHVDETKCQGHTLCNFTAVAAVPAARRSDGDADVADAHVATELEISTQGRWAVPSRRSS